MAVPRSDSDRTQAGWHEERERHLADCRSQLAPEQRRVLDGYYVDELGVETLAQRHDRSTEAIYKMLQRIRHALLECMERKRAEASL